MKKILYIGPYYNTDSLGISSENIIKDILESNNFDLYIKPIYINHQFNTTSKKYIELETKEMPKHFDLVIQHCPYHMMVNKNLTFENTKFIGIPISPLIYGQNVHNSDIISKFDLMCVDSLYSKSIAESMLMDQNLNFQLYHYGNLEKNTKTTKINLGIHNNTIKIYYIGTFNYNETIIESIISSFYSMSIMIPNVSLIMYLTDMMDNPSYSQKIDELLNKTKNNIPLKSFNKHFIIKDICTENILHMLHNTGDILINIDISGTCNGLNREFAKLYGNHIIDYSNTAHIPKYATGSLTEFYMLPSDTGLSQSIMSYMSNQRETNTVEHIDQPKYTIGSIINNV